MWSTDDDHEPKKLVRRRVVPFEREKKPAQIVLPWELEIGAVANLDLERQSASETTSRASSLRPRRDATLARTARLERPGRLDAQPERCRDE